MYLIPSPGSKQVKHVDQQGHEELEAHDKISFQAAATAAAAALVQVRRECWRLCGVRSQPSDTEKLILHRETKKQLAHQLKKMMKRHHLQLRLLERSLRSCLQPKWVQCIVSACLVSMPS